VDTFAADISGGLEAVPVSVCHEKMPGTLPPMFVYLKSNVVYRDAQLEPGSASCTAGKITKCVYTREGCLQPWFLKKLTSNMQGPPYIKECWGACKCKFPCPNRVVQCGMKHECQVYWASDEKGWGIRTIKALPIGSFVFEFVGEILTATEMDNQLVRCFKTCKNATILILALDADFVKDDNLDDIELYVWMLLSMET
jgi:euchromatic histone-lysine N-methyltransferase